MITLLSVAPELLVPLFSKAFDSFDAFLAFDLVEEESVEAETEPDAATAMNGEYLRQTLLPLA